MDRLQRNGGTAGIVAAFLLAVGFILFMTSGLDPDALGDPAKALPFIGQQSGRWVAANLGFLLGSAVSLLFVAGLVARLREKAPTRAATVLYLAVIGLAGYALSSMLYWHGGTRLAAEVARDQVAANHAWVAVYTVGRGLEALGNGFVGAASAIAGWAIVETAALPSGVGWLGIVAGVITLLQVFAPAAEVLFLGSIVLTIIWLAWTGSALRKG